MPASAPKVRSAPGRLAGLMSRYDDEALRPFHYRAEAVAQAHAWPALREWCLQGLDRRQPPLALALHGGGGRAASLAASLALDLDGSLRLAQCGGAFERLKLRARVKWRDATWWRPRQQADVWDSGWVRHDVDAWSALTRFSPRRPTFIVMQLLPPALPEALASLQYTLKALQVRQTELLLPVRLLVFTGPALAAAPGGAAAAWNNSALAAALPLPSLLPDPD